MAVTAAWFAPPTIGPRPLQVQRAGAAGLTHDRRSSLLMPRSRRLAWMAARLGRKKPALSKHQRITSRTCNRSEALVRTSYAGALGAWPSKRRVERHPSSDPFVDLRLRHSQPHPQPGRKPPATRAQTTRNQDTDHPPSIEESLLRTAIIVFELSARPFYGATEHDQAALHDHKSAVSAHEESPARRCGLPHPHRSRRTRDPSDLRRPARSGAVREPAR